MTVLISLFRYVRGYLKIRITGYSPERFLNLCKNKKIAVWGLLSDRNAYVMYIKVSGFRRLKPILKKTQTKVTIEERIGLPFFFYKYRKRKLFFIGFLFCLFLIYSMTFFVWNIDLQGNQAITDNVLLEYLNTQNVKHGMLKHQVNCEQLVKDIRKEFDDIIWVSASMEGTNLYIHVKENTDTFELKTEENEACDLVAEETGIVQSIITRSGVPLVKAGDEVHVGDILVSGTVDVLNDAKEVVAQKKVKADADIVLERTIQYEDEVSKIYDKKEYTEKKRTISFIKIGTYTLQLGWKKLSYENYDQKTTETQLKMGENFYLPLYIGQKKYYEYKEEKSEYSEAEMEKLLQKRFKQYCKDLGEDVLILKDYLVITQQKKGAVASCTLIIQQEVGIPRKIVDFEGLPMIQ